MLKEDTHIPTMASTHWQNTGLRDNFRTNNEQTVAKKWATMGLKFFFTSPVSYLGLGIQMT
jgi:hypothetical protein